MMNNIFEKVIKVLDENGINYKERANAITLNCPFCQKNKLDINKNEGFYICYYCASKDNVKGKNPAYILSKITSLPYLDLKAKFSDICIEDISLDTHFEKKIKIDHTEKTVSSISWPKNFFRINLDISIPGLNYLKNRGIDAETAKKHEIRYSTENYQVIFPVFSNELLVGYQGRSILKNIDKKFSKITMPGFQKSNFLMFEKTINTDSVILAEGPISALKFAKTGIPFVASMGKYVSANQMQLLKNKGIKKIYLALDKDAYKETIVLVKTYNCDFDFYYINVPSNKDDFGDCTFEECNYALAQSFFATQNNIFPSF